MVSGWDDVEGHRYGNIQVWFEHDLVETDLLDRFVDRNDLAVDIDTGELDDGLSHIVHSDRTEQVPCITSSCGNNDARSRKRVCKLLGFLGLLGLVRRR